MRLHHLIEDLQEMVTTTRRISVNIPEHLPEAKQIDKLIFQMSKTSSFLVDCYDQYSQIDVQDLIAKMSTEERKDLSEYSIEMLKNGLTIKPYDFVCISFMKDNENYVLLMSNIESEKYSSNEYSFIIANRGHKKDFDNICLGDFQFRDNNFFVKEAHSLIPLLPDTEENREIQRKKNKKYSNMALFVYLVVCAMLQSKNIEIITVDEPTKLNKNRTKKGKLPINKIKEIRINYNGRRYLANGREEGGGTHASPRLHWRRGHIRRLSDGKITNVRPTLVGEIKGQEPKMPTYKIVKGEQHV